MEITKLQISWTGARDVIEDHYNRCQPGHERAIDRAYQAISTGRPVIQLEKSIRAAGLGDDTMPRLAIARATAVATRLSMLRGSEGQPSHTSHIVGVAFYDEFETARSRLCMRLYGPEFARTGAHFNLRSPFVYRAVAPIIPRYLQPKQGLRLCHLLWEARWRGIPVDPYLLRRIGTLDLWVVRAAWDFTAEERAVLASRVTTE